MFELFDIKNVMTEIWGYSLSYLEVFAVMTALVSVFLAAKNNIHTWTTGIVSVVMFFILFYQVQLYSDMLLQGFFFVTSILGIIWWKKPQVKVSSIGIRSLIVWKMVGIITAVLLGFVMSQVHTWFPQFFLKAAEFPYADAFTTTLSIIATILLIKRKLECWYFWFIVDILAIYIYHQREIYLVSIEYFIFLCMVVYGYFNWKKELVLNQLTS